LQDQEGWHQLAAPGLPGFRRFDPGHFGLGHFDHQLTRAQQASEQRAKQLRIKKLNSISLLILILFQALPQFPTSHFYVKN
jgi:hypothetical protein